MVKLKMEINLMHTDITSATLGMIHMQELLERIKRTVSTLAQAPADRVPGMVERIIRQIEQARFAGGAWHVYEERYSVLNPDSMSRLSELCPSLSPTELKVCTCLKMHLSTKETAEVLHTSARNIEGHRYSIRRKLGLIRRQNLATFLATL